MANKQISELPPVVEAQVTDVLHLSRSGVDQKATVGQVLEQAAGGSSTGGNIGAGVGIFAQKNGAVIELKSLLGGAGINITSDSDEITISLNIDDITVPVTTQTSNYTVTGSDNGSSILCSHASGISITVPLNATDAISVGTAISFQQTDAGQITFVPEGAVVINTPQTLLSRAQYSVVGIIKVATDEWLLMGDLQGA